MKLPVFLRRVSGHSMEPTLKAEQLLLVSGWLKPRPNDLVVAKANGREVVKRTGTLSPASVELLNDAVGHGRYGVIEPGAILGRVIKVI